MSGIGEKLDKLYEKNTLVTTASGMGYSTVVTIAPMLIVMVAIYAMTRLLAFDKEAYAIRELFTCTVLYIFIFSLIASSVFDAVISRFIADMVFEENFGDIMPCFYTGLVMTMTVGLVPSYFFFYHEYTVGQVDLLFILYSFVGYVALLFVFYCMTYLNVCKEYEKTTLFYLAGMSLGVASALVMNYIFHIEKIVCMLLGLDVALLIIGVLAYGQILKYFPENGRTYGKLFGHLKTYWALIIANAVYITGLYVHNFVFWNTDLRMVVRNTFVCAEPFDMATFLGLLTNITASVVFITSVERRFAKRYRHYVETLIGGRLNDIEDSKNRMFRQIADELIGLVRIQLIISATIYLAFIVLLPQFGISGMIMEIYPCLAAGYFILFLMYGGLVFLYYYNDLVGALMTTGVFFVTDLLVSIWATGLSTAWYGIGLVIGAFAGWCITYLRLRWVEKHIDSHIFCEGDIRGKGHGFKPDDVVYLAPTGLEALKDGKKAARLILRRRRKEEAEQTQRQKRERKELIEQIKAEQKEKKARVRAEEDRIEKEKNKNASFWSDVGGSKE